MALLCSLLILLILDFQTTLRMGDNKEDGSGKASGIWLFVRRKGVGFLLD
jgi:hypothetical protein